MMKNTELIFQKDFDIDLRDCKLIGEGHNGFVFMLPDGKVMKIFKEMKYCKREYNILKEVQGNKHFPNVYESMGNYIIRDFVSGECLKDYIKKSGMSRRLSLNIIDLIEDFMRLKFSKIDIRCKDIYVQEDEFLMIIDPKSSYTKERNFPRHLAKGLKKLKVLDKFMNILKQEKHKLYECWEPQLKNAGLY